MAEYANYSEQGQEPGPLHPRSILSTQWDLQKASLSLNYMRPGVWNALQAGKGMSWSGIVGLRGIASGKSAFSGRMGAAFSPANAVHGILKHMSPARARAFEKYGIFGNTKDDLLNTIKKIVGGGTIENSRFKVRTAEEIEKMKWNKVKYMTERNFAPEIEMKYFNKLDKAGKQALSKQKWMTRVARMGRFASWVGAASIAFDVGSFIGKSGVNAIGAVADRLERTMSGLVNRQMEFGGKVGIGFYSGASGTERQRALSAIGSGRGSSGMGSEAGYQHVDSTW